MYPPKIPLLKPIAPTIKALTTGTRQGKEIALAELFSSSESFVVLLGGSISLDMLFAFPSPSEGNNNHDATATVRITSNPPITPNVLSAPPKYT